MDILDSAIGVLGTRPSEQPWLTARGIMNRLGEVDVTPEELEGILIHHVQHRDRRIRYSYYPSKRTMEILWGHVDVVGDKTDLPALTREDQPDTHEVDPGEVDRWVLISHNHRDVTRVLQMRDMFRDASIGVWIFESDIKEGGEIAGHVREAILRCSAVVVYVTRNSLGSLWVRKELEAASLTHRKPVVLVMDGSDTTLLTAVADAGEDRGYVAAMADSVPAQRRAVWLDRAQHFLHSMHEFVDHTIPTLIFPNAAAIPALPLPHVVPFTEIQLEHIIPIWHSRR